MGLSLGVASFLLNSGAISWSSKKQTCTVLSTMEAEFVASVAAVQEAIWLGHFISTLSIMPCKNEPITICCDSQVALVYTKDPKCHGKTKHIGIKYNFVRDALESKEVCLTYLLTTAMVADPLTKPIPPDLFACHVQAMGLRRI